VIHQRVIIDHNERRRYLAIECRPER
jgi:hypothetical protein